MTLMTTAKMATALARVPGREALAAKGWLRAHKWLLLRRTSQLGLLLLFGLGPWLGIWIVKGTLTSSRTLDTLPLTDPFFLLQSLAAGHLPYREALIGVAIVIAFYLLVGGRVYCSWVCPMNVVTDTAAWLRRRLNLQGGRAPSPTTRYWLLGAILLASFASGTLAWEWINPVSLLHRGLLFGFGAAWAIILGVFLYDLLIATKGWCGHLCPMGATYSLLNFSGLPKVSALRRSQCDDCLDCYAVCPEPQVIRPALKGVASPIIASNNCTHCGRCIDVCAQNVFQMTTRFHHRRDGHEQGTDHTAARFGGGGVRPVH